MLPHPLHQHSPHETREADDLSACVDDMFDMVDSDGDGVLTVQEFRDALGRLGTNLTAHECRAIIKEVDPNGDGVIDKEEFAGMIHKHLADLH